MVKHKIIFILLMTTTIGGLAFSQQKPVMDPTKTVSGTVTQTDFVGNTITILTSDQQQIALSVPGNASILRDTHEIGLMDIKDGDPVTIKYSASNPGQDSAISIIDNKPGNNV